jgi:hypothetical protein
MLLKDLINTRKKADCALGQAIAFFTSRGYTVSIPLADNKSYDLVVEDEQGLQKVQVKGTSQKSTTGYFQVGLRTCFVSGKVAKAVKHDSLSFDYLFVVTDEGGFYLFPVDEIDTENTLTLSARHDKYKV